ncbi:uncharacterized protein LOC106658973 [Trichogramma pretiosum]|uniref:uncharacterized protein LOC106658973 n=1 Tax=Trichogramma pretiosum TaxID=7493 RepID=UPI0006C98763|nr:uncharacterized protein LOC106658973 [Trichogramma pretiosum]
MLIVIIAMNFYAFCVFIFIGCSAFDSVVSFVRAKKDDRVFHYQQAIVVQNYAPNGTLTGCAVMEVYEKSDEQSMLNIFKTFGVPTSEITMAKIVSLMQECDTLNEATEYKKFSNSDDIDIRKVAMKMQLIFPGTKWCGPGSSASGYHELGADAVVDKCCRAHDFCPIKIIPHDKRYGLRNDYRSTISHCFCDQMFYNCLTPIQNWRAKMIKNLYFRPVAKSQCIEGLPENFEKMELVPIKPVTDTVELSPVEIDKDLEDPELIMD